MSSSSDLLLRAPAVPGFRLLRKLGEGGMGAVWLAEREGEAERVALKLLTENPSPESLLRFRREREALAGLAHPTILRLLDADLDAPTPWLALELIKGRSLDQHIASAGALSPDELLPIAIRITEALTYAHALGLVHRDIKPANILLRGDGGEPVLADFGLAFRAGQSALTLTGEAVGTLAYMPPEVLEGRSDRGGALDQWALGVTFYEALTGVRPFPATSPVRLLQCARAGVAPPSELNPAVPPELDAIILRCLQPDPAERFPDMAALAAALEALSPDRYDGRNGHPRALGSSNFTLAATATLALILLVVAGLAVVELGRQQRRRAKFEALLVSAGRRLQSEEGELGDHLAELVEARALERIAALMRRPDPEPRSATELERRIAYGRASPKLRDVVERADRGRAARLLRRLREAERRWSERPTGETSKGDFPALDTLDQALEQLATGRPITARPPSSDTLLRASVRVIDAAAALRSPKAELPATLEADTTGPGGLRREAMERAFITRLETAREPLPVLAWTTLFSASTEPDSAIQRRIQTRLERRFQARLAADDRPALRRLLHATHGALLTESWLEAPPVPAELLLECARLERDAKRAAPAMLLFARALAIKPDITLEGPNSTPDFYAARAAYGHQPDRPRAVMDAIHLAIRAARLGLAFRTVEPNFDLKHCDRRPLAELAEARPSDLLLRYWLVMVDIQHGRRRPGGSSRRQNAELRRAVDGLLSRELPRGWHPELVMARGDITIRTALLQKSEQATRDQLVLLAEARSQCPLKPDDLLIEELVTLTRLRAFFGVGRRAAALDERIQRCAAEAREATRRRYRRSADGELAEPGRPGVWMAFSSTAEHRRNLEVISALMARRALRQGDLEAARRELAEGLRVAPKSGKLLELRARLEARERAGDEGGR